MWSGTMILMVKHKMIGFKFNEQDRIIILIPQCTKKFLHIIANQKISSNFFRVLK